MALGGRAPAVDPTKSAWSNYWAGALTPEQVGSTASRVLNMPRRGVEKIVQGTEQIAGAKEKPLPTEPPTTPGRRVAGGVSQIVRGVGEAAAPVALPIAAVAAPIPTAIALATGAAAGYGAEKGAKALGLAPEYSALLGDAANIVAGGLGPKMTAGLFNLLKVQPSGGAAAAELVKFADEHNIPLSAAARTGIERLRRWQAKTAGSKVAQRSQAATQEGLTRTGQELLGQPPESRLQAGIGVAEKMKGAREEYAKGEKTAYTQLEDIETAHTKEVVTGTRRVETGVLDQNGKPIVREEPITEQIGLPVNLTRAKSRLEPLLADIERQMPIAQREQSAGLQGLRNLLEAPDTVSATTADGYLSSIKTLLRAQNVNPKSKRLLGEALDAVSPAVDQAVAQGGPEAVEALAEGRRLTRAKYAAERTLKALRVPKADEFPLEPVKLTKKLTAPGDVNIGLLRKVEADAPDSLPAVGRAMLQGFLEMTPDKALKRWNEFGDQSKAILLNPQQIAQWGRLFRLADLEARTPRAGATGTPAQTTVASFLTRHAMRLLPEAAGMLMHHPVAGAVGSAVLYGGKALSARALAHIAWDPSFARLLTDRMETSLPSGAMAAAASRGVSDQPTSSKAARAAPPMVPRIAEAIKSKEGWQTGSRSQRNNNPGNLKPLPNQTLPGMIGRDQKGFAIFRDYDAGWNALLNQVQRNVERGLNLQQFFAGKPGVYAGYAPAGDQNKPLEYANFIASQLGIDPRAPLSSLQ